MSLVNIPYIPAGNFSPYPLMDDVSAMLGAQQTYELTPASWSKGGADVSVSFTLAYSDQYLFVKYFVIEPVVKATYYRPNEPVYNDSCVELFIAFDDDANYYNLEFNCAGTCLGQYGSGRDNRVYLPANLLKQIKHLTVLRAVPNEGIVWELSLAIPLKVFCYHPLLKLSCCNARVNTYKCGDELEQPHHLCWGQIESAEPNFHRIEYFKRVLFTLSETFSVD
ncbi:hypothetical protein LJ707_01435 [Mucilaginibacter sp. UR6-1]|uniref:carbohydrate-binding family 9-like protein n=1 Tax=Mucilaginibacter sp. UR6-1 TaxID=1435643 RepID=UPI001E5D7314|nr:carbohydrate-binding family 9-like protein [Mucilaginibacter sp. UR6-1]MCC8407574.1 hypothetical protein [Mucilaginibacter sp. UR6-1]